MKHLEDYKGNTRKRMSHLSPGLISAYNSLTDRHLAGYFSNTRIRRHLQRAGLITRSGRIVPDKEYRLQLIQRAHQRHVRECLAQAIFHKVLEMERLHQIEIKRKLEEFARRERVYKIKVERSKRYEGGVRILSPRPPTYARVQKQHSGPEGDQSESSESPGSSRPNTAPGKMQRPVRLKPIQNQRSTASFRRSFYRLHESPNENNQRFNYTMEKESQRRGTTRDTCGGISPYCLPVINNFVTPVPPATKRRERGVKVTPNSTLRGRRLRPTTASSGADVNEDLPILRSSGHQSRVQVSMVYFGKSVHLSHDLVDMRDEVKVFQQHCGGENLCVYKGKLHEGETFQFVSRRHRGFPFSLTFFLNGLQVERLSSCCEFKHRKGPRLGGRHGHFGFSSVEHASPCYKCIIAMGMDKKPTPPPKKVKEERGRGEGPKDTADMEMERTAEEAASHSECETSQTQDTEIPVKDETVPEEDKPRDDYEEDFEADDEGAAEDPELQEKKSLSPCSETDRVTERESSESEDEKDDVSSHSDSSSADSESGQSDAEGAKEPREEEQAEHPKDVNQDETAATTHKQGEPNPKEVAAPEAESALAEDADVEERTGTSEENEIYDTSVPEGKENGDVFDGSSENKADEKTMEESKEEEEQEKVNSVQEKLTDATQKDSQCNAEPEVSGAQTEEPTDKGLKQDAEEKSELKCEQSEAEVENPPEPKEQRDETDEEQHKTYENSPDETVQKEEDTETSTSGDDKCRMDHSDAGRGVFPVSEEKIAEDDTTSEPQNDTTTAAAADTEAAEEQEEGEEDTAVADPQEVQSSEKDELNKKCDETGAPDNQIEAEAMTASETKPTKAEPSKEQEALSCEEAPVTDAETQQENGGDIADFTAEKPSSSLEGSKDAENIANGNVADEKDEGEEEEESGAEGDGGQETMEKVDATDEKAEKEKSEEENKQGEALEVEGDGEKLTCDGGEETTERVEETDERAEKEKTEEACEEQKGAEGDSEQLTCDGGEGSTQKVEDMDNKVEKEKSEEEAADGEKLTSDRGEEITQKAEETDEKAEKEELKGPGEKSAEKQVEKDHTEEELNDGVEAEENITELSKTDLNVDGQSNQGAAEEDKRGNEEKADESGDTEKDEGDSHDGKGEWVESKDDWNGEMDESNKADNIHEADEKGDGAEEPKTEEKDGKKHEAGTNRDEAEYKGAEEHHVSERTEERENKSDEENVPVETSDGNIEEHKSEAADADYVSKTPEEECDRGEKGQVDAESGEKDHNDHETTKQDDDEKKSEQPVDNEGIEAKMEDVEWGESVGKKQDAGVEQASVSDAEGKQNKDESDEEQPVASGTETKEGSKPEDMSGRDSVVDIIQDNIQLKSAEVIGSGDAGHKLAKQESESGSDKHPHTENTAGVELSAADGEDGEEMEDVSKASEEGASVLLKPPVQPAHGDAENTEEVTLKETPETLEKENSADLVTNWVSMHQASRYFETFVEPLEDLRDSTSVSDTEPLRAGSPLRTSGGADAGNGEKEEEEEEEEEEGKTRVEAVQLDNKSDHSAIDELCERENLQVEEEVNHSEPKTEDELNVVRSITKLTSKEESTGSRGSLVEHKAQDDLDAVFKSEVESIDHSGVTDGKTTESRHGKHTATDELKDQSSLVNENREGSDDPEGPSDLSAAEVKEMEEKTHEGSGQVTEITDFTACKSEDGSPEEFPSRGHEPRAASNRSVSRERDVQPNSDVKHSLSRLSSFSVNETLFRHSSHPLMTAVRSENGH